MRYFLIGLLFLLQFYAAAKPDVKSTHVVFYNVENLFDTKVSAGKSDSEYSPGSAKEWDATKYSKKLTDISKVLTSIDPGSFPGIIGLCEVENRLVLSDLVSQKTLSGGKYSIIHKDSHDRRGIDVALLYRNELFRELVSKKIPVGESARAQGSSREMLYAKMIGFPNDTLHIFVAHWHSRAEGQKETEPKRIIAAKSLRFQVDSIFRLNRNAKIIVMGDMNDEPENVSIKNYLGAKQPAAKASAGQLYNLCFEDARQGHGTIYYRGRLLMFDNLIVSGGLINNKKGWIANIGSATVFHQPWMEYRNKNGKIAPNRTYSGNKYLGGVSDHFPVCFRLKKE
jgi:endonuclease/exonuclease/phosphatase family metal-dependent hydrolase